MNLRIGTAGSFNYQANKDIGGNHRELYTVPLPADEIDSLAATAIRIGYKQSDVSVN